MPFEDMGFGHQGTPRFVEIFVGHRLYIADGFSRQTALGMQRLKNDMHMWRSILRDATTITTKVMALIVITDDLRLLSTLLSQPIVNKTVLAMTPNIAPPLTAAESSLRWPLQHQFRLGVHGEHRGELTTEEQTESLDDTRTVVGEHCPSSRTGLSTDRTSSRALVPWNPATNARDLGNVRDLLRRNDPCDRSRTEPLAKTSRTSQATARQGILESLVNPNSFEPNWDPFHHQLRETDARLRLASLQIVLRRPSAQTTVPNRLAQVGSSYYDPFSGLPMLWSPTQQKIYSVGKDRYDDGGDSSFDISVPAIASSRARAYRIAGCCSNPPY